MAQQIVADALVEQAMKETGIASFDSDSYREGLDVFINDFNAGIAKDRYTDDGVGRAVADTLHYLRNRLKVSEYLRQNPELLERPVERPVFVMGVPRTGTTLLSNLLAADPARRSPLTWEIDDPVPPVAAKDQLTTDPRAVTRLAQEKAMLAANPDMGKYYRGSAIYPNECVFFMAHDFKTLMIESKGILPQYKDFIFSCDMTSAYEYHKKFLQVLQHHAGGVWNCKKPSHALFLEYLFKVYPDARVIWTHRDPFTATGSLCSIISLSHMAHMGRIDAEWLGQDYPWQAAEHANRIMDFRDKHGEDKIIDVHYADMTDDPIGTMKQLYARLGDEWTAEAEAGIQAWVDDNPQNKFGKHEYKLAQYGLTKEGLEPMFERYLSRYDVAREG
ncbi:sulfotransferase family protein [Novosphingobium album (ex Liu et al. 2023)]|uniref:Sulfotransferase n=1 Tax=Novosphingobium album (ex Liu et al. 2023) TaxID=3031130 RepID=A0ABT5WUB3_9SPHN|nr:sulfotransferase [Novosphingobium album (ex Liu et al. 2023)]MDE8653491.1 sulfotransferase [Novosphingobium album (ex Liu et al. 2023)]